MQGCSPPGTEFDTPDVLHTIIHKDQSYCCWGNSVKTQGPGMMNKDQESEMR